eukprot:9759632-Alexandrium_andersonii.AAC.1
MKCHAAFSSQVSTQTRVELCGTSGHGTLQTGQPSQQAPRSRVGGCGRGARWVLPFEDWSKAVPAC